MSTKENPHKGGPDAFRGRHSTTPSIDPPCDPFAGSLEEQAKRREEQRKAEAPEKADDPESVVSSKVPLDPNGLHMELRAIVKDTRDNEFARHQMIKAFADKHGQLISVVKKQVRAIEKELDERKKEDKQRQDDKAAKRDSSSDTEQHQSEGEGKPIIDALPGELHIVVRKAEQALLTAGVDLFQRAGVLARPAVLPTEVKVAGAEIAAGSLVIEPVSKAWLAERMNEVATWRKYNERKGGVVRAGCPDKYAEHYIAKKGEWNARVLTGIVEAPTLRRDGSLLTKPGYDPLSGLYLDYRGLPVRVPDKPTKDDAIKALDVLKEPFEEFPFVSEVDRSAAVSGQLTVIARRSLRTAPYHAVDAPVPGSGKGLLVDTCAMVAIGRVATVSTLGVDEAETEKRVGALLMRGVPFINLDNIARPVEGDFICSLATQETVDPRVLGVSITITIPSNTATVFLTGNNLVFRGDMTRRVVLCRIDPRCERPDSLQFKRNLHEFVPANRHRLLSAAFTILRAYVCAGSPPHGKAPYGSFEQWDALIRGALLWLDQPDPLESREQIVSNDPTATGLQMLLDTWFEVFKSKAVTVNEVVSAATPDYTGTYSLNKGEALRHVILEIASNRDGTTINPRTLSHYLRKNRDRIAGEHRLEGCGTDGHAKTSLWSVRLVSSISGVIPNPSRKFRSDKKNEGEIGGEKEKGIAKNTGTEAANPANPANPSPDSKSPGANPHEVAPETTASDCKQRGISSGATGATGATVATKNSEAPPDSRCGAPESDDSNWSSLLNSPVPPAADDVEVY